MTVRMSAAQVRALGIDVKGKVRVRKTARGAYHTICKTCGEEFHTQAAEDRHVNETPHRRYELRWGH